MSIVTHAKNLSEARNRKKRVGQMAAGWAVFFDKSSTETHRHLECYAAYDTCFEVVNGASGQADMEMAWL